MATGDFERALQLARDEAVVLPLPAAREQMRTAILARGDGAPLRGRTRTWWPIAGALALAAAAVIWLGIRNEPQPRVVEHGSVAAEGSARFERAGNAPDEIVRLYDGVIHVEVSPLAAGERFRVVAGDGEVEVRGTAFTVAARDQRLASVVVEHGVVEVRPVGRPAVLLHRGERWSTESDVKEEPRPQPEPRPEPQPQPQPEPQRQPQPQPEPQRQPQPQPQPQLQPGPEPQPAPAVRADEQAFNGAWAALRSGDFHAAAAGFARSVALAPDGPLAGDARFWHGVALARQPRPAQAIAAFREVLDDDPGNTHRGEASAMLGWLLVDAHELAEARQRFTTAADDPDPAVAASGRAGLAALAK